MVKQAGVFSKAEVRAAAVLARGLTESYCNNGLSVVAHRPCICL